MQVQCAHKMHLNGLKIFCFVAEMPQWLTQVSIIGQKIANLDTLFRFCGQAAEIEKAYDNNKKDAFQTHRPTK